MGFIQLSPPHGYKYVLVMVCMFSQWTVAFPYRQATAFSVAKVLLEKIICTWGTPLQFHSDQGTLLLTRCFDKSVLFGWFYTFHCTFRSQTFGLVEHTSGIIKTQLAKLVQAL